MNVFKQKRSSIALFLFVTLGLLIAFFIQAPWTVLGTGALLGYTVTGMLLLPAVKAKQRQQSTFDWLNDWQAQ